MTGEQARLLVPTGRHLETPGAPPGRLFRDFVADAAARLAPELDPATPHATRLLTREALAELPPDRLRFPDEPAARVALAHAVDRAVGRLRRAGTTPDHLIAAGTGPALLLADILAHVEERLDRAGLQDARGAAGLAARRLGAGAAADLPELDGAVVVQGMAAWEPDDLSLLEALHARIRAAGGAGLAVDLPRLTGPIGHAFDDALSPVADHLERRWASLVDAPEILWRTARGGTPAGVIAAPSLDAEARAVVARVLDALAEGTPPERIALVVPDLDEKRLEPLRAHFADARVPFAEPRGRPVASCPEGRIALGLLSVAAGPVTRDQLIELLRAPGVHPGAWMERAGVQEAVRRAVALAHRLRDVPVEVDRSTGRLFVDALVDVTRARPDEGWMPRALDRALKETRWIGEGGATATSRREVARRLLTLVDRLELGRPPLRELGAALRGEGAPAGKGRRGRAAADAGASIEVSTAALALRALGESAAAVRALREAVRAIVDGAAAVGKDGEPTSAAELAAELGVAVSELGIGLGTEGAGAVRIGRPADLAGLEHDLVIVTGLDERAYSGVEGDLALLDERTRQRLPATCRPPSARERETWRRAELCWAMAGADRVVLSYAAGDDRDVAAPHRLLRWAEEHGPAARREPASRLARDASRVGPRSVELCALTAGQAPRGDLEARVAVERERLAFFLDPRMPAAEHSGRVLFGDDLARARLVAGVGGDTPARPVAVTAIERAAGCAFAAFARRVLRVRRVDDLSESADNRERGTLVHRALHAAFEGQREAADLPRALLAARAAAERALGLEGQLAPLRREALLSAVDDAVAVVERTLAPGASLRFLVAEKSFGDVRTLGPPEARWAALPLRGDEEGGPVIYVDGQIDRVDASLDRRRARVVDYKTGRLPAADEHGQRAFQLPLYAAVVADVLGCEEVEAVYVAVKTRGVIEEHPRSEEDRRALGARREEVAAAARRIILRMWDGEVAPRPAKAALCTRCEARDVCRRPAVAPVEEAET